MADYEGMVANKTAAVFACALEMGAIVAVGQGDVSRRLADAGRAMGIAYQMRDDVLDLWGGAETGKQVGIDLRRGKKSLPVVFGLSQEGTPEGERVRAIYSRPMTDDSVESVTRLLEGVDAPSFCMAAAEQHWDRSKSILRDLGLGEAGARSIIEAGELLVQRES
jgi:geranylgeranyl pyrophosphate synthase